MRFGANYIPSKNWLHHWLDWDAEAVDRDLRSLAEAGFDHIRGHLIWPYFQVNPNRVSPTALEHLKEYVALCEKNGLDFCLSLFTGWMSGFHFFPAWLVGCFEGRTYNMFTDPQMIEAEKYYIRCIAEVVGKSENFLGFDLGNELSCVTPVFKPDMEAADAWNREMLAYCESVAPGKMHNNGVDHQPWFIPSGFSRKELADCADVTALHCWTEFTGARKISGIMGVESVHIADFCVEIAKACASKPGHQYWVQEFGSCPIWHEDGSTPGEFLRRTLDNLCTQEDVWGVTWWCSHDINRELTAYNPLEYELGLFDIHQNPKDTVAVFREYIERTKRGEFKPVHRDVAVVLDEEAYNRDPWSEIAKYMDAVRKGISPAIVWASRAEDAEYLKMRGITELIR